MTEKRRNPKACAGTIWANEIGTLGAFEPAEMLCSSLFINYLHCSTPVRRYCRGLCLVGGDAVTWSKAKTERCSLSKPHLSSGHQTND
jgi:hypothetical protein